MDFSRLLEYLFQKYKVRKIFYYTGIRPRGIKLNTADNGNQQAAVSEWKDHLEKLYLDRKISAKQLIELAKDYHYAKFLCKIGKYGYSLRLVPLQETSDNRQVRLQKSVIAPQIIVDVMDMMDLFDHAVIFSGNAFLHPLLSYLRSNGKKVTVISRPERCSRELKQFAGGKFIGLTYLREKLKRII